MCPALAPRNPAFPDHVGKYRLLLPLGTGGMATVYLARSSGVGGFERDVALKLIHAHLRSDEDAKLQLLDEARLAARIRHPHVVPVLEVEEDPSGLFLVMEYVEGDTLSGLVRGVARANQALDRRLIARIINDALLGLHAAHGLTGPGGDQLGLVHRDFSPQNILISIEGVTRLSDFGVAKAANRAVRTKTGLTKGKISYMSPEQARGKALDRRSDVWAAGVVLWELLAGRRMHEGEDDVATLLALVTESPRRLSAVVDIPPQLDAVVAKALEPEVDLRFPDAESFRLALERAWNDSGYGMASREELAATVRAIAGPMLSERRELAEYAARGCSPPASGTLSDPLEGESATATLPSAQSQAPTARTSAWHLPMDEATETSAVLPAVPQRKGVALGWLVAGGALLGLLAYWSLRGESEPEGPVLPPAATTGAAITAASPQPSGSSEDSPQVAPPVPAPKPRVEPTTSDPDTASRPRPAGRSPAKRSPARAAKRPPPATPAPPAPTVRKPGLASSPYDAPKSTP